ncbi:MAG: Type IV secretion system protein virB2 precursor [Syntrophorhabdaceae bacterium PtaU1.Bin034]|nr:MAG: Type IV secretion system protein virB2 precursor [Syntrophorhabdaceae bacterium PtaU1.Bin034]
MAPRRLFVIGILAVVVMVTASPVLAASGIAKVDTFLDKISTLLKGAGVTVCAISLMWAGYKFFFAHADMMYCVRIVAGGLLIGGATEIAGYILG